MNRFRIITLALCSIAIQCLSAREINVTDFGAVPDDGLNDLNALNKAAEYCRNHPGTILKFNPGIYDIIDSTAIKIERDAVSGAYGENVQGHLFRPDGPYVKALDLSGCRKLTVEGAGATLMLHGWYEAVCLDNAHDVTVDGLSLRYKRHPNTVGRIVNSTPSHFDMWIDREKYPMIDSIVTGRVHFFDPVRNRLYTGGGGRKELITPEVIRIHSKRNPAVGDFCVLRHGGHYRPAVMLREASGIRLSGMKIHSQPGMGVVGHRSSDITLDGLQIVPEPGDVISTNTDATHFTSCTGHLDILNCMFKGQGDDCTNIHNYYSRIYPMADKVAELRVENADLHALALDPPERGDSMLVIDRNNMAVIGRLCVKDVATSEKDWKTIVTFDKSLQDIDTDKHIITNLTRFPVVTIAGNSVDSHLARAFLVKSPNVTIKNNRISGSTQTAIKLGAELGWNESGPVDNVLIEDNYISGCGYDASERTPSCITLSTEASQTPPHVNRNIVIRHNIFDSDRPVAILLKDGENISVYDNIFNPAFSTQLPIVVENCSNVTIRQNL
ncbi:MAG: right-handed parallel beta-helix repeat-containing protein [Muribaculaceae bacterium]|nr:right-handed parallel beta-helix repeat-containing protein [Muribaculaceae bacterium]